MWGGFEPATTLEVRGSHARNCARCCPPICKAGYKGTRSKICSPLFSSLACPRRPPASWGHDALAQISMPSLAALFVVLLLLLPSTTPTLGDAAAAAGHDLCARTMPFGRGGVPGGRGGGISSNTNRRQRAAHATLMAGARSSQESSPNSNVSRRLAVGCHSRCVTSRGEGAGVIRHMLGAQRPRNAGGGAGGAAEIGRASCRERVCMRV